MFRTDQPGSAREGAPARHGLLAVAALGICALAIGNWFGAAAALAFAAGGLAMRAAAWALHRHRLLSEPALPDGPPAPLPAPARAAGADAIPEALQEELENLQWLAQHDPLTNLPNRTHFQQIAERRLTTGLAAGAVSALMFIDVDNFKTINDTMGHRVGDQVLQLLSERLKLVVRADPRRGGDGTSLPEAMPVIGRLGGDEFTIFLPDIGDEANARRTAARVLRVLAEPCELGARSVGTGGSIGIALAPLHGATYEKLMRSADTAMYHAKRAGRNRFEVYSEMLDAEARAAARLEQELREALASDQFELHFQPQFDFRTRAIRGVEALVRWRHPSRGLLLPGTFIPFAEQFHLINDIGDRVILEAVKAIARWNAAGRPLRVSVNVSPAQFRRIEFLALIKACLSRFDAPPHLLELEITESLAMEDDPLTRDRMQRLQQLGVMIALDDFGTGYSNLSRLMALPLDTLKIDRSLIANIAAQAESRTLVNLIVAMARGMGLQSIAEGVEDATQFEILKAMDCDLVQGFLMSEPQTEADLLAMLESANPGTALNAA